MGSSSRRRPPVCRVGSMSSTVVDVPSVNLVDSRARRSAVSARVEPCRPSSPLRPDQEVQGLHRRRRHLVRGRAGGVVRSARPERRRQVDHDAHGRRGLDPHQRRPHAFSASTPTSTAPRSAPSSASCRRPTTSTPELRVRDNLIVYGRYFGIPRDSRRQAGRRAARVRPAERSGQGQGRRPLRRHEAPAHHRARPRQRPAHPAARRADHRARPAGQAHPLGPAVPAEGAGHDAACSPRTTWMRRSSSATAWSSSTRARSWPRDRRRR